MLSDVVNAVIANKRATAVFPANYFSLRKASEKDRLIVADWKHKILRPECYEMLQGSKSILEPNNVRIFSHPVCVRWIKLLNLAIYITGYLDAGNCPEGCFLGQLLVL